MALNEFQKEEARRLFKEGRSTIEVYRHLGARTGGFESPIDIQTRPMTTLQPTFGQQRRAEFGKVVSDIPQDIGSGVVQLGQGYIDRFQRGVESGKALLRGEQGIAETGVQFGANLAGAFIADPAFQLLKTGASLATTPEQETQIGQAFQETVSGIGEKTGITNWYSNLSPRAQRNVNAALDILDVAPVGLTGRVRSLFSRPEVTDPTPRLQEVLTKAEQGDISDATRVANATLDETVRTQEVDKLTQAYQDSLVGDRVRVNRLLQEQANDMSRGDVVITQDQLIRNLADEGIIPDIRGKLADFTTEIRNLSDRQNKLFKDYEPILAQSRATASIDDFGAYARNSMSSSRNLRFELDKANAQLDRLLNNLRQGYGLDDGGKLTAKQIDEISREANARSKAYRDGGNTFEADVYSELGRAARSWLSDNIPDQSFRQVNDEWLRLENLKRTAEAMQNQQVDVGILGRALGSYVTTLTGVTLAAGVSNPFAAVAAGILTKMGGDAIADAMRSTRFSPEIRQKLQQRLSRDAELRERLKQTATSQENKNLIDDLSRMLPPAPEGAPRSSIESGAPIRVTPEGQGVLRGDTAQFTREGAIRRSDSEPAPLRRGLYPSLGEAELQKLKTDSFRKILNNVGVDPDEVQKAIIGGGIGTLLMLYMNDDGSMLPAFGAVLSVGVSRAAKLNMLDEALKANRMRRDALMKAGMSDKAPQIKTLEKQAVALRKEKTKVEDSLSPGLGIKDVSKKTEGATPSTNLLEEAKGKTLDEFIKAQGTPVYHGTKANFTEFKPSSAGEIGKGVYFYDTSSKAADHVGEGGRVIEAYVDGKLATMDDFRAVREELGDASWTNSDTIDELARRGYVGIVRPEGNSTVYNIFDPKNIKTKESLEQIWNSANQ